MISARQQITMSQPGVADAKSVDEHQRVMRIMMNSVLF